MTLIPSQTSPFQEVWVALDLETTGLDPDTHRIIEVGAVKFEGERVLDTYQTLVNPHAQLDEFIKRHTNITQSEVDGAPPFTAIAAEVASFIGRLPIVGHNLRFDLDFLDRNGLALTNPRCDTWEMAYVLLPGQPDYSLAGLSARMGIELREAHRAVHDATATKDLFLRLGETLASLDVYTLAEMQRLAVRSRWAMADVLTRMEAWKLSDGSRPGAAAQETEEARTGVAGLDVDDLRKRLQWSRPLRTNQAARKEIDPAFAASLFESGGPMSQALPGFEERPQQAEMARAVAEAINRGQRLMVEAGTGVGKSLAYLLPAVLYALANSARVVVSTNTINLQEQMLNKDIPALLDALSEIDGVSAGDFRYTHLKGRANYLCFRRWSRMRSSESLSESEARLAAKVLTWLQTTSSGDRSELNLGHSRVAGPWERLSAQGAHDCLGLGGPCFLRAARDRAAASHLVIVNHSLLLSNLTIGGSLIPDHDVLIVDEAHHLDEEATRHLGFSVSHQPVEDQLRSLVTDQGLLNEAVRALRASRAAETRRDAVEKAASSAASLVPRQQEHVARLFALLLARLADPSEPRGSDRELRVTTATRAQPAWSEIEIQWQNVDIGLSEIGKAFQTLRIALEGLEEAGLADREALMMELVNAEQANLETRERLAEFVSKPRDEYVYWMSRSGAATGITLHAAPLEVGETLDDLLFSQKECVVMTSATLSTNQSFSYVQERTGFSGARDLILGSPFDYPNAALLCVPGDVPEPTSAGYQEASAAAILEAALAAEGRTMALFTSYASLNAAAGALRSDLESQGIGLLAQGADGTPSQLMSRFLDDPTAVLLGTASFWEGVDLAGEVLKVLLVMRLPFNVPSEPVFAARSELYEDSFKQFALPQAVLRLRQGFGRLIRSGADRGVVVILDRRILSRRYGKTFLDSLPSVTLRTCSLHEMRGEIAAWIA